MQVASNPTLQSIARRICASNPAACALGAAAGGTVAVDQLTVKPYNSGTGTNPFGGSLGTELSPGSSSDGMFDPVMSSDSSPNDDSTSTRPSELGGATAAAGAPMPPDPDDENETDEQRFERLNTRGVTGNGQYRPHEARAAAEFEKQYGVKMARSETSGDYVVTRGNSMFTQGVRVDLKYTAESQNIARLNADIMRNPGNPANGYQGTLDKAFNNLRNGRYDYIGINTKSLSPESLSRIQSYINQQAPEIIAKNKVYQLMSTTINIGDENPEKIYRYIDGGHYVVDPLVKGVHDIVKEKYVEIYEKAFISLDWGEVNLWDLNSSEFNIIHKLTKEDYRNFMGSYNRNDCLNKNDAKIKEIYLNLDKYIKYLESDSRFHHN